MSARVVASGGDRRSAHSTRSHARVTIRPDIHERFQRILAKVDAEIAARAATPLGARSVFGLDASDLLGCHRKPFPDQDTVFNRMRA